jgi:hypothetical protein
MIRERKRGMARREPERENGGENRMRNDGGESMRDARRAETANN